MDNLVLSLWNDVWANEAGDGIRQLTARNTLYRDLLSGCYLLRTFVRRRHWKVGILGKDLSTVVVVMNGVASLVLVPDDAQAVYVYVWPGICYELLSTRRWVARWIFNASATNHLGRWLMRSGLMARSYRSRVAFYEIFRKLRKPANLAKGYALVWRSTS